MASSFVEPSPRYRHQSALIQDQIYVIGGYCNNFDSKKSELSTCVEVFDQWSETWKNAPADGDIPPALYWGACTTIGDNIFVYGGYDSTKCLDTLYLLDTTNSRWSQLCNGPTKKYGSGMVAYQEKLFLFGGYTEGVGRTSEMHCFEDQKWTECMLTDSGDMPPPCHAFSLTMIDDHRAVLFGGMDGMGEMNDVYVLDLAIIQWTKIEKEGDWPEKRFRHAATCIGFGQDFVHILITGGVKSTYVPFDDLWLLNTQKWKWKRTLDKVARLKRFSHSATAINLSAVTTEVTLFGGENYPDRLADTFVLRFRYLKYVDKEDRDWKLVNRASGSQLGTAERLTEKQAMKRKSSFIML